MNKIRNYINGELVSPLSKKYMDNINPTTGKVYALIPDSDASDIDLATQSAIQAKKEWGNSSIEYRFKILMKIADLIERDIETLALAESIDNGKPLTLARNIDIPRAVSNFQFFATAIKHFASNAHELTGEAINYTLKKPIGVVACISPWNLPLYSFTWKIAPALAAGNCVIAKPSEITPMTAYLLSKICMEAGLPKGVLNIVHGLGSKVGNAISEHIDIKAISFTGGTETGRQIAKTAAPMFKKLSLELGGKNPNIIFADCNYEAMLKTTLKSSFANQGQICLCGSRIFIERTLYKKFKTDFVEKTKALIVGDPLMEQTDIGAIVSKQHQDKIMSYIELAKKEGGRILCGGEKVKLDGDNAEGFFISPTIIEGLSASCRTNQEEIFGPVVTIMPFDTEEEVLNYANSTVYGLSATLWTDSNARINRFTNTLEAGIIWVNSWLLRDLRTPFGGVKDSGIGREGGFHALEFFTETKNICIKYE
ncbi:MAG: aldehyde dehydrogenase [Flavobacteriaceae bacterium]|nr:aldehyde dehydrogenase [Flavobacteriaceae bacterium]